MLVMGEGVLPWQRESIRTNANEQENHPIAMERVKSVLYLSQSILVDHVSTNKVTKVQERAKRTKHVGWYVSHQ